MKKVFVFLISCYTLLLVSECNATIIWNAKIPGEEAVEYRWLRNVPTFDEHEVFAYNNESFFNNFAFLIGYGGTDYPLSGDRSSTLHGYSRKTIDNVHSVDLLINIVAGIVNPVTYNSNNLWDLSLRVNWWAIFGTAVHYVVSISEIDDVKPIVNIISNEYHNDGKYYEIDYGVREGCIHQHENYCDQNDTGTGVFRVLLIGKKTGDQYYKILSFKDYSGNVDSYQNPIHSYTTGGFAFVPSPGEEYVFDVIAVDYALNMSGDYVVGFDDYNYISWVFDKTVNQPVHKSIEIAKLRALSPPAGSVLNYSLPTFSWTEGSFNGSELCGYEFMLSTSEAVTTITTKISIKAKGDYSQGWPKMQLYIDSSNDVKYFVREWEVNSSEWNIYETTIPVRNCERNLHVVFSNDFSDETTDRNLYVDWIKVGDNYIQAESTSVVYDKGDLPNGPFDGSGEITGQEDMYWEGSLKTTITTSVLPEYTINAPLSDGLYFWYVRDFSVQGTSSSWRISNFIIDTTPPESNFTDPQSGMYCANIATLSWTGTDVTTSTTSYHLQYKINEGNWQEWLINNSTWTLDESAQFDMVEMNLVDGTSVYFRVRAQDEGGNLEEWTSGGDTFIIVDNTPPSTPTLSLPIYNGYENTKYPLFDWTDVTDASGVTYELQYTTGTVFPELGVLTVQSQVDYWDLFLIGQPGLDDGSYFWHVRAVDGAGNKSSWSSLWVFNIDTVYPELSTSYNVTRKDGKWIDGTQWTNTQTPLIRVTAQDTYSGLKQNTAGYLYTTNSGTNWFPVTDGFEYWTNESLQYNWRNYDDAGLAEVNPMEVHDGNLACSLPCNFSGQYSKARWEHVFPSVDFTEEPELSFWLYLPAEANNVVSSMTVSLKSGNGWYYKTIPITSPTFESGWKEIVVLKEQFGQTPLTPQGWNQITALKFEFMELSAQDVTLVIDKITPALLAVSSATSTGPNGSVQEETITAGSIPFYTETIGTETQNQVRVMVSDRGGNWISETYTIKIDTYDAIFPESSNMFYIKNTLDEWIEGTGYTDKPTPECKITIQDVGSGLDITKVGYKYSTDGGTTWLLPSQLLEFSQENFWENHLYGNSSFSVIENTLTITAQQGVYAHVSCPNDRDNIWAECAIKSGNSSGVSWAPGLTLYWSTSTWARVSLQEDGYIHAGARQINFVSTPASVNLSYWYYVRIKLTPENIIFEYRQDDPSSQWTQITSLTRSGIYQGAPSDIILGKGYETDPTYPNMHLDNISETLGNNGTSYIKDVRIHSPELGAVCSGNLGTTDEQTLITEPIVFNQSSETQNKIKFVIRDVAGNVSESTAFIVPIITIPTPPSNFQAIAVSSLQISISWTDNSNTETGFKLERSTDMGSIYTLLSTLATNTTSYIDQGLDIETTYYYRVKAYNIAGDSEYSNTTYAVTLPSIPTAPDSLQAVSISSTRINLTWTDNSNNESGFKIERKTSDGEYSQVATVNTDITSYNDDGLTAGTTYLYHVKAYNISGDSLFSNESSAVTSTIPQETHFTYVAYILENAYAGNTSVCTTAGTYSLTATGGSYLGTSATAGTYALLSGNYSKHKVNDMYWSNHEIGTVTNEWVNKDTEVHTTTPTCRVQVQDIYYGLDVNSVGYTYSTNGGDTWLGLLNGFDYTDDTAAQSDWPPSEDAGNVVVSTSSYQEGNKALKLPCNFSMAGSTQACWTTLYSSA
ncbi:MAG: fibronectin type III domain-containing protein, partial [Elusimicrobiota bacterium]